MSDISNSDDSIPTLSSYPPAFVSLITTFIKRSEEAETRAHKALVILKAKDDQVIQLQQRMEILEKIACRLEEVMVPPLNLPKSPQSLEELCGSHPRDVNSKQSHRPVLETLYERNNKVPMDKESSCAHGGHIWYEKCQDLIDGLERSNCQLREALTAESQQRVRDHEQYIETVAKMTQAIKDFQNKSIPRSPHTSIQQPFKGDNLNHTAPDEFQSIPGASGDADFPSENKGDFSKNGYSGSGNNIAVFDKEYFKKKVGIAERILSVLQSRLENQQRKNSRRSIKRIKSQKSVCNLLTTKGSLKFNGTPNSSSALKLKRVHISSQCFLSALRKQNKKLKNKYRHVCEKFAESLTLCEKLQKELVCISNKKGSQLRTNFSTQSTQTDDYLHVAILSDFQDKLQTSRSSNLLQGRLDAAAKVMAKQCKQIQDLQKQLGENLGAVDCIKKRLARAESAAVAKDVLVESTQKQLKDSENKYLLLTQEMKLIKDSCCCLKNELSLKINDCIEMKRKKEICELEFTEMKTTLESKLVALSSALQQKENVDDQMTNELQNKLISLKEQFVAQVTEARDRLLAADFKIQEIYLGIETFLKLLFTVDSPELSPTVQAEALEMASDILQLPPVEVQTILHSSRCGMRVGYWIRECNRIIHEKVFAKTLGHLLLEAVMEARAS